VLRVFQKAGPEKQARVDSGMGRLITGDALDKLLMNHAVFEEFRNSMVDNWQKSPVKYCFSPLVPGHISHVAGMFKGRKISANDKPCWDFSVFKYMFEMAQQTVKGLAVQPSGMTDDAYAAYLCDVDKCFEAKYKDCVYRLSNGECYTSIWEGIMKSGWLLTIDVNSICQLLLDNLVKIRMGETDKQILADPIVAGGDDTLQSFREDFDKTKYLAVAKSLGFEMSPFEEHKNFNGCEFFSTRFYLKDGTWTFKAQRFTKHVKALRTTKLKDLASALSSHMVNHVWDTNKYNFFKNMFMTLRKSHPDDFPLAFMIQQKQLQYRVLGCEAAC
jgi:hypothetical protein